MKVEDMNFCNNSFMQSKKLEFYQKLKVNYDPEPYLDTIRNFNQRRNLTNLRIIISNHNLTVESGSYNNVERELPLSLFIHPPLYSQSLLIHPSFYLQSLLIHPPILSSSSFIHLSILSPSSSIHLSLVPLHSSTYLSLVPPHPSNYLLLLHSHPSTDLLRC